MGSCWAPANWHYVIEKPSSDDPLINPYLLIHISTCKYPSLGGINYDGLFNKISITSEDYAVFRLNIQVCNADARWLISIWTMLKTTIWTLSWKHPKEASMQVLKTSIVCASSYRTLLIYRRDNVCVWIIMIDMVIRSLIIKSVLHIKYVPYCL